MDGGHKIEDCRELLDIKKAWIRLKITKHASHLGVKVLTLYAFSTENWKRPTDEVNFLMQLPVDF